MSAFRLSTSLLALVAISPIGGSAHAQGAFAPGGAAPRPTPDADALADAMRRLATSPRDVDALVGAGELSLRLGDLSGAASLFARAEKIDPMNARVKAGMGSILVQEERPGAALRYFDQAIGYGLDPRRFAGDRGLAYDLIGEQERAQRDYRTALKEAPSDDLTRRYALSLGISGRRDEAFAVLDPLLRKQDRSAWRARAFVLAMGGDQTGANTIATSMMPGFASGLRPFFQRLPSLPAAERAFAVHFGEIRPTPERIADARLVPALAPLAPDLRAPTLLAANSATPASGVARGVAAPDRRDARTRRPGREVASMRPGAIAPPVASPVRAPAATAVVQAPAVSVAASTPVPAPTPGASAQVASVVVRPSAVAPVAAGTRVAPVAGNATPTTYRTPAAGAIAGTATGVMATAPIAASGTGAATSPVPVGQMAALGAAPPMLPRSDVPGMTGSGMTGSGMTGSGMTGSGRAGPSTGVPFASGAIATTATPSVVAPAQTVLASASSPALATVQPLPSPVSPVASATTQTAAASSLAFIQAVPREDPMPERPARPSRPARVQRSMNDSILAKIVAGIEIPEAELAAVPVVVATPGAARGVEIAPYRSLRLDVAETPAATGRRARRAEAVAEPVETPPVPSRRGRRGEKPAVATVDTETPIDRASARKTAAAKKLVDRKAAEQKLADRKEADEAAAAKKAERAQPSRIWVQVAGGANEGDLTKAWSATKAKAPVLAGKPAYATPLRATNRVLTGPFKTDAEARAFVNTLARQGVSAFSFTSEAGQKVARLPAK